MSVRLMARVWDLDLSTAQTLVMLCLADYANDEGENCYPSMPLIASRAKVSPRQAMRIVASLEAAGVVAVDRSGRHNRYRITLPIGDTSVTGDNMSLVTSETSTGDTSVTSIGDMGVTLSTIEPLEPPAVTPHTPRASSLQEFATTLRDDVAFDEFWHHYPRKVGKPAARKAYAKALTRTDYAVIANAAAAINAAAARYGADPNLPEERFIPHPSTWLNRDGWCDGPCPPRFTRGKPSADETLAQGRALVQQFLFEERGQIGMGSNDGLVQ